MVGTHTQVIIAAPNLNRLLAPSILSSMGKLACYPINLLENSIRVVHFLFQNLTFEKVIVLESISYK